MQHGSRTGEGGPSGPAWSGGGGGGQHHHHPAHQHHQPPQRGRPPQVAHQGGASGGQPPPPQHMHQQQPHGRHGPPHEDQGHAHGQGHGATHENARPDEQSPAHGNSPHTNVTKICDLRPYMRNVSCVFIVLEKGQVSEPTKPGEETRILQCLVADASAAILLSLVESQGELLQPGDIIRLSCGFCTLYKNNLVLTPGRYGVFERIGEFTMIFSEALNMSQLSWIADPQNPKNIIPLRTSGGVLPSANQQQQPDPATNQGGTAKRK